MSAAETCMVESGLLVKKPCGQPGVSKCANCEQPLCAKHCVPQVTGDKKTSGFLCPECARAWRESEKMRGEPPPPPKPAAKPAASTKEPPREHSGEIAFTAGTNVRPQEPAAAPAPEKPEPPREDTGPLEFTPQPKKPQAPKK
jgi:hypothetical protein